MCRFLEGGSATVDMPRSWKTFKLGKTAASNVARDSAKARAPWITENAEYVEPNLSARARETKLEGARTVYPRHKAEAKYYSRSKANRARPLKGRPAVPRDCRIGVGPWGYPPESVTRDCLEDGLCPTRRVMLF